MPFLLLFLLLVAAAILNNRNEVIQELETKYWDRKEIYRYTDDDMAQQANKSYKRGQEDGKRNAKEGK